MVINPLLPEKYRLVFLSLSDVSFFSAYIQQLKMVECSTEARIGIYNLELGIIQSSPNHITDEALEEDDDFQMLLIQAKFLAGIMSYTTREQTLLHNWLIHFPEKDMASFFKDYILKYSPEKQRLYPESSIQASISTECRLVCR